jgi:hypothetical protein
MPGIAAAARRINEWSFLANEWSRCVLRTRLIFGKTTGHIS